MHASVRWFISLVHLPGTRQHELPRPAGGNPDSCLPAKHSIERKQRSEIEKQLCPAPTERDLENPDDHLLRTEQVFD